MKTYFYYDQDGEHTITDDEIIKEYFDHWCGRMIKAKREKLISHTRCIEDFCIVYWAYEPNDLEEE